MHRLVNQFFTLVGRALTLRCPRCGGREILSSWLSMVERCPSCGHKFERMDGYWVGSMILSFAITAGAFLTIFLAGIALWWPDPPYTALLVISLVVSGLTPLLAFPWSRTLFVAVELAVHPLEPHEVAAAAAYVARHS